MTLGGALIALSSIGACHSGASRDCQTAGSATVCLDRGTPARLTATGLEPGSSVVTALEGSTVDVGPPPRPMAAGFDGRFPPPGVSTGLVIPRGSGPLKVMVTVSPRAGAPTKITFQR